MAKTRKTFVCLNCGTVHPKWSGQCSGCGQWNTVVEEVGAAGSVHNAGLGLGGGLSSAVALPLRDVAGSPEVKVPTPILELNRALDGGLVPGSLVLLAGEPGIGKSTLILQLALQMPEERVLYVSGEESAKQIKLRAARLGSPEADTYVFAEPELERVLQQAEVLQPGLLIIDSIQTIYAEAIESAPGSITQVRECTTRLMRFAKATHTTVVLIGHINKDGMIAGPKVLEHLVDVVLEFEGDRNYNYRIVRSSKNRFGSTPELGVFEMRTDGLHEAGNASALFLGTANEPASGVAVAAVLQGSRPLLVEAQALTAEAAFGTPQRSATGLDLRRLHMLLAILEKKCGFPVRSKDVFVNLTGGIRLDDPSLDLAVLAALASSLMDMPLAVGVCLSGEAGLTGEVRPVPRLEARIQEAAKMGFRQMACATQPELAPGFLDGKLNLIRADRVEDVLAQLGLA